MELNKRSTISIKKIGTYLLRRLFQIIMIISVIILLWLAFFTYNNLYQSVLVPREIESSEIVARKQKVNLDLFETVKVQINKKLNRDIEIQEISNPFD